MSTYEYPPTSQHTQLIEHLLQPYRTIISEKDAIYISTPMTSGLLYMQAFSELPKGEKNTELSSEKRSDLFSQNCQHARSVAAMARLHFPTSCVIDPTRIEIKGWEQNDYLTFWRKVIIDHAKVIVFVDNWYYSNGCAYEFLVGAFKEKVMIDEKENTIYARNGRDLIHRAYNEHLQAGYNNLFLQNIIQSLDKYLASEDGS